MNTEKLAIFGGPRAVIHKHKERWRNVPLRALAEICVYGLRDINTRTGGGGPIAALEKQFCFITDTQYGLIMNSGTSALHSAFIAVGVKQGDEVILPAYTWFATASPVLQCGATPVFCDIDERTLTACPDDVEKRITPSTRAICVVHVWGNPARLDRFVEIARRHNLALIEDCSHAHGASYQGRPVGSWGDIGCFSMQGTKPVSGGELGIAVTNDPILYDRMLVLGHNGRPATDQVAGTFDIDNMSLGLKYRPHLYGVLMARASLKRLGKLNCLRQRNHAILNEQLAGCKAVRPVETLDGGVRAGLMDYLMKFDSKHAGGWARAAFVDAARAEGVPIQIDRYTLCGREARVLHETPMFRSVDLSGFGGGLGMTDAQRRRQAAVDQLPTTERLADQLVSLPAFTKVSETFVRQCGQALKKVAEAATTIKDIRIGR